MSAPPHKIKQLQYFCENKEHSTQFDLSLPPKLPAWPLRYLRFHTLGLWLCRANCLTLSANTFFKQTTRGKHALSTQYPILPKYAGFLTLPFLAGAFSAINTWSHLDKSEAAAVSSRGGKGPSPSAHIPCPSYHTSIPPKSVSEIQESLERG